jgi:branched-chain amino acid transport system substrate-binding protein
MIRARNGTSARRALAAPIIAVLTLAVVAASPARSATAEPTTVHIGALLSLTGGGSTLGNSSKAALQVAAQKWNAQRSSVRKNTKVVVDFVNTNLEPDKALTGLRTLAKRGAKIVIGPQSSSEVAAIKDEAASLGVLVVSQGSTASSLATPDDNVFRFVPTDHVEGRAIADLIVKDGATTVVPMWRNDAGNQGLADTVRSYAPTHGATVTEGFRYEPDTSDFTTALQAIAAQVTAAVGTADAAHVAVYLGGFEETAKVLAAAKAMPGLAAVRWYGGDGSAQSTALLDDKDASAFAESVHGYPSPLVALPADQATKDKALVALISAKAKVPADAFTLAAYDAFNVAATTLAAAGKNSDTDALREGFTTAADGYHGVTGTIELDAAGDRTTAPYAFWSVCSRGASTTTAGARKWVRTGLWEPATDPDAAATLTSEGCPS